MKNKYMPFSYFISSFEGTSYKSKMQPHQIFYFLLFLLAFTSTDIIFYKFLELHSKLSEKKIFITIFPFLTDSLKPPYPLMAKTH